jgi:hypothetical protein
MQDIPLAGKGRAERSTTIALPRSAEAGGIAGVFLTMDKPKQYARYADGDSHRLLLAGMRVRSKRW